MRAKQTREYLQTLADGGVIKAHELYSALCTITHPSAESVILWYSPGDEDGLTWQRARYPTIHTIEAFMTEWRATNELIFQYAFIPLFFNLRILHKIDFLPKIPELKQFPFSNFSAWQRLKKAIYT
jgi:hypothetical protein